ncbi:MAG: hypothetical protein CMJ48_10885 [Planctomycetaceae bacterium]|nr:hypothetical protein [Planctomycetaceae bacterium]
MLPSSILNARKLGFGVPFENWLRGPLLEFLREVLFDSSDLCECLFDRNVLEQIIDEHVAGRRNSGFLLWKLMNFCLWARRYRVG